LVLRPTVLGYDILTVNETGFSETALKSYQAKIVNEILSEPSVKSKFEELGVQPVGGTLAQTNSFVTRERQRWSDLIRAAGIQAN
jgi:tripartite-type tricarboxylate transporter receptor subunit TctC